MDHFCAPVCIHVMLTMRRLHHHGVKVPGILTVCEIEAAVVEIYGIAPDDDREIFGFQNCRWSGSPLFPKRFTAKASIGQQSNGCNNA